MPFALEKEISSWVAEMLSDQLARFKLIKWDFKYLSAHSGHMSVAHLHPLAFPKHPLPIDRVRAHCKPAYCGAELIVSLTHPNSIKP